MHRIACLMTATGVSIFGSIAAATSDPASTAAPSVALIRTAAADSNRLICRDRVATGSRLAYARDCHTREEWKEITRAAREYVSSQQLKGFEAGKPCGRFC